MTGATGSESRSGSVGRHVPAMGTAGQAEGPLLLIPARGPHPLQLHFPVPGPPCRAEAPRWADCSRGVHPRRTRCGPGRSGRRGRGAVARGVGTCRTGHRRRDRAGCGHRALRRRERRRRVGGSAGCVGPVLRRGRRGAGRDPGVVRRRGPRRRRRALGHRRRRRGRAAHRHRVRGRVLRVLSRLRLPGRVARGARGAPSGHPADQGPGRSGGPGGRLVRGLPHGVTRAAGG